MSRPRVRETIVRTVAADLGHGRVLRITAQADPAGVAEVAEGWLRDALADGPRAAREMHRDARGDGISTATLRRAREAIGVIVEQARGVDGRRVRGWTWRLDAHRDEHLEGEHLEGARATTSTPGDSEALGAHIPTWTPRASESPPEATRDPGHYCTRCRAPIGPTVDVCARCEHTPEGTP